MNIFIYGNSGFKKEIHETLEHANIKFKLDDNSVIKDINELEELKQVIQENPNDIYLIDDEKIIKKNALTKKIKFLVPKDGIEEEFLLDNGIADLSVDSLKEIPKYILQKHDEMMSQSQDDIHDSIIDIVDDAYNDDFEESIELDDELAQLLASEPMEETPVEKKNDDLLITKEKEEQKEDLSFDELSIDDLLLDEELNLSEEKEDLFADDNLDIEQDINLDDLESLMSSDDSDNDSGDILSEEELNSMMNFDEDVGLNNVSFDYDDNELVRDDNTEKKEDSSLQEVSENDDIISDIDDFSSFDDIDGLDGLDELDKILEENNIEIDEPTEEIKVEESISNEIEFNEGDSMSDEFSELDTLNEADILSALDGVSDIKPVSNATSSTPKKVTANENVEITSSNSQDIADLISKLLNNKTLEITIKVKD